MLLKKTGIALCGGCGVHTTACLPASISSSNIPSLSPAIQRYPRAKTTHFRPRNFATLSHDDHDHQGQHEHHDHPQPFRRQDLPHWPTCENPTPYEIFNQKKSAPYSKSRFYQLVKIYHPDHHDHHVLQHGISRATKLERYRLLVAANDILCDPAKRRAYDLYGAGWAGQADMKNDYRTADRSWRQEPGNASQNATWEDWEQWYHRRDGKKAEPLYMSNSSFVLVIAVFTVIAAWGQATRAGTTSLNIIEMRDREHSHISREMQKRQSQSVNLSREGRVESFLRQREGWGYAESATTHTPQNYDASSK